MNMSTRSSPSESMSFGSALDVLKSRTILIIGNGDHYRDDISEQLQDVCDVGRIPNFRALSFAEIGGIEKAFSDDVCGVVVVDLGVAGFNCLREVVVDSLRRMKEQRERLPFLHIGFPNEGQLEEGIFDEQYNISSVEDDYWDGDGDSLRALLIRIAESC